jgi:hypothetical protein
MEIEMSKFRFLTSGLAVLVAVLAVTGATVADAAPKPAFRPGTWVGHGSLSGTFDLGGEVSPVRGRVAFTLTVSKSGLVSGRLKVRTTMTVSKYIKGSVIGVGALTLSGTASDVRMSGSLRMTGELTDRGVTVPFDLTEPLRGRLVITKAGCTLVTGMTSGRAAFTWSATPKTASC